MLSSSRIQTLVAADWLCSGVQSSFLLLLLLLVLPDFFLSVLPTTSPSEFIFVLIPSLSFRFAI